MLGAVLRVRRSFSPAIVLLFLQFPLDCCSDRGSPAFRRSRSSECGGREWLSNDPAAVPGTSEHTRRRARDSLSNRSSCKRVSLQRCIVGARAFWASGHTLHLSRTEVRILELPEDRVRPCAWRTSHSSNCERTPSFIAVMRVTKRGDTRHSQAHA